MSCTRKITLTPFISWLFSLVTVVIKSCVLHKCKPNAPVDMTEHSREKSRHFGKGGKCFHSP